MGEGADRFARAAYLDLKEKIESRNILVMQAAMDVGEVGGLALADGYPRVILVNSNDGRVPSSLPCSASTRTSC